MAAAHGRLGSLVRVAELAAAPRGIARPVAAEEDRLLDVREAAKLIRMSADFVYEHAGEWGGRKVGERWRFSERKLRRLLAERVSMSDRG